MTDDDWRGATGKNCHIFRKRTACILLSCNMNRSILHIASCNVIAVTVKSLITFLSVALSTMQVNSTRGLGCSTRGCIVPTSKLKFRDYLWANS